MSHRCPRCHNTDVVTINFGRKAGGTVGTVAGAVGGYTAAAAGAEAGALAGAALGPVGIAIGALSGAVIGGLVGGVAGGTAGATLGHVVDENVLDNFNCTTCGFVFGRRHVSHTRPIIPHIVEDETELDEHVEHGLSPDAPDSSKPGFFGKIAHWFGGGNHGPSR